MVTRLPANPMGWVWFQLLWLYNNKNYCPISEWTLIQYRDSSCIGMIVFSPTYFLRYWNNRCQCQLSDIGTLRLICWYPHSALSPFKKRRRRASVTVRDEVHTSCQINKKEMSSLKFWLEVFCLFEARVPVAVEINCCGVVDCTVCTVQFTLNTASNSRTRASNWQNTSSPKYNGDISWLI